MRKCTENSTVVVGSTVLWREIEGETVLLDTTSSNYYTLNHVGSAVWSHLISRRSVREAVDAVAAAYDVPRAGVAKDVVRLVQELAEEKLVAIE